jgi:hypothetical protein
MMAKIWKMKKCTRCGGDMFLDREEYGWCAHCLQCGYSRELGNGIKLTKEIGDVGLGQAEGNTGVLS